METVARVRRYRNPHILVAVAPLAAWLSDHHYSIYAVEEIVGHVAAHGTLEGSGIEPEDEGEATEVFVDALPEVPFDSPAWDRDTGVLFDAAMLAGGNHPWPIPTLGDDDRTVPPDADLVPPELEDFDHLGPSWAARQEDDCRDEDDDDRQVEAIGRWLQSLRPISGGAPEFTPTAEGGGPAYEPTAEDLADLDRWAAELERRRGLEDMRDWYARNALEAFNADLPDSD
jgi:hypothetical protein